MQTVLWWILTNRDANLTDWDLFRENTSKILEYLNCTCLCYIFTYFIFSLKVDIYPILKFSMNFVSMYPTDFTRRFLSKLCHFRLDSLHRSVLYLWNQSAVCILKFKCNFIELSSYFLIWCCIFLFFFNTGPNFKIIYTDKLKFIFVYHFSADDGGLYLLI